MQASNPRSESDEILFAAALRRTISFEGTSYVWHAADHGGPTRFGITLTTLANWRGKAVAAADVEALSLVEATDIYRSVYWVPMRGLYKGSNASMAGALFDSSVLCGLRRVVIIAQIAVGVHSDGVAGPATLGALADADPSKFVPEYVANLADFFIRLAQTTPSQGAFLRGWVARVIRYLSSENLA